MGKPAKMGSWVCTRRLRMRRARRARQQYVGVAAATRIVRTLARPFPILVGCGATVEMWARAVDGATRAVRICVAS